MDLGMIFIFFLATIGLWAMVSSLWRWLSRFRKTLPAYVLVPIREENPDIDLAIHRDHAYAGVILVDMGTDHKTEIQSYCHRQGIPLVEAQQSVESCIHQMEGQ